MADLFSARSPLMIRLPSGEKRVMAECFAHSRGLLYFDLYWHLDDPDRTRHVVAGPITGLGPWRVGDTVVPVLGCHGTDHELASTYEDWRHYLEQNADGYPPRPLILAIARRYGALIDSAS